MTMVVAMIMVTLSEPLLVCERDGIIAEDGRTGRERWWVVQPLDIFKGGNLTGLVTRVLAKRNLCVESLLASST